MTTNPEPGTKAAGRFSGLNVRAIVLQTVLAVVLGTLLIVVLSQLRVGAGRPSATGLPSLDGVELKAMTRPFTDDSPWNTPIADGAVFSPTDEFAGDKGWVNLDDYGTPVVLVDPRRKEQTISYDKTWARPAGSVRLRLPKDARPATGTDANFVVVDPASGLVHDFWKLTRTGGAWHAQAYGVSELTSSGVGQIGQDGQLTNAGTRASGVSGLGGVITGYQFASGTIDHALALVAPDGALTQSLTYPAIAYDRFGEVAYSGTLRMGTRLAVPPNVPEPSGLSPNGKLVFTALVRYGGYIVDRSGANLGLIVDPRTVKAGDVLALREHWQSTGSDLERIIPLLQVVTSP